jgi:hypothetical protein
MRITASRTLLATAVALGAVVAALAVARANGTTCKAYLGGLETGKQAVPELVVFNTTAQQMTVNVTVRDATGLTLATAPAPIVIDGFHSAFLSLSTLLTTAGEDGKPYEGRITAEVTGDTPFADGTAVVHATQYFGKAAKGGVRPAKPKAAFIVRPLFVTGT